MDISEVETIYTQEEASTTMTEGMVTKVNDQRNTLHVTHYICPICSFPGHHEQHYHIAIYHIHHSVTQLGANKL